MHVTGVLDGGDRERSAKIIEEMMAKIFPNLLLTAAAAAAAAAAAKSLQSCPTL